MAYTRRLVFEWKGARIKNRSAELRNHIYIYITWSQSHIKAPGTMLMRSFIELPNLDEVYRLIDYLLKACSSAAQG